MALHLSDFPDCRPTPADLEATLQRIAVAEQSDTFIRYNIDAGIYDWRDRKPWTFKEWKK